MRDNEQHTLRVLGVDPGTARTGWGIVERTGRKISFCAGGVVSTKGFRSAPERLRVVHAGIRQIIEQWTPHTLSLEKAFVAYNVQSAFRLGEARGVILLAAAQAGLHIAEYNPTQIKTAVVGYGRADKTQVQKAVFALLGNGQSQESQGLPTSQDATDALAAAICYFNTSPLTAHIQSQLDQLSAGTAVQRPKSAARSWRNVSPESLSPDLLASASRRGRG